jgi:hypothetical protein
MIPWDDELRCYKPALYLYDKGRERGVGIGVGLALHGGIVRAFLVVSNRVCIKIKYTPNSLRRLFTMCVFLYSTRIYQECSRFSNSNLEQTRF